MSGEREVEKAILANVAKLPPGGFYDVDPWELGFDPALTWRVLARLRRHGFFGPAPTGIGQEIVGQLTAAGHARFRELK